MFIVPNVHQSVIALPAVGMDNALRGNLAPDDGLERFGRAVRDQLGVHRAIALIDAENRLLERAPAPFTRTGPPANPSRAKEAFINLNHTNYLFFSKELMCMNQCPECQKIPIHGFSIALQEQSCFGRVNVDAKAFNNFSILYRLNLPFLNIILAYQGLG